jgi:hypothetical protein
MKGERMINVILANRKVQKKTIRQSTDRGSGVKYGRGGEGESEYNFHLLQSEETQRKMKLTVGHTHTHTHTHTHCHNPLTTKRRACLKSGRTSLKNRLS